ncbi:MAG: TIM-barrel domain-containing protein [Lentisphaeria bacterium]
MNEIVVGKRRFTCLSPTLVRLEFSPTGRFEDRPSVVAAVPRQPIPFDAVRQDGEATVLTTGSLVITSRENDGDFFPGNLMIEWKLGGLTQNWQFGDRDYRNLGGTIRSLDGYHRDGLLAGVHPAGGDSPDGYLRIYDEVRDALEVYARDGRGDWADALGRQGIATSARVTPERVYNRVRNYVDDQAHYPPGLLSRNGYFLLNDATGAVLDADHFPTPRNTPGTRDLYFFGYGLDYAAALRDFTRLSGAIPLPARNLFGIIFSRFPAFSESESRELVARFEQEGAPLSVLVLDLEWHVPDWWHWDWNPALFPDPEGFLAWLHGKQIQVTLNVHPEVLLETDSHFDAFVRDSGSQERVGPIPAADRVEWKLRSPADRRVTLDMADPAQVRALQQLCCEPIIRQGADFWWLDGAAAKMNGVDTQLLTSKAYYETSEVDGRRGMLLGRYGGLGSHRYGVYFTGDTHAQWEVLRSQCEFNIRAGQVGMAYVSHDIGGFLHPESPLIDPVLYLRWLQFGVFSPILRFHSSPGAGSRQPWDYGPANLAAARHWLQLRNSLVPYLYGAARTAYETGLPLVRGLYLDRPGDEAGYRFDEYFLGDAFLVAPILTAGNHRQVYLPPGAWFDFASGQRLDGGREMTVYAELRQLPVYVKAGAIVPRQDVEKDPAPVRAHVQKLLLDVYPGAAGSAVLYEDDSRTQEYRGNAFGQTVFTLAERDGALFLSGAALQGRAFGVDRQVRLRIAVPAAPARVRWQGHPLPAGRFTYDAASRRLLVDLGTVPVDQAWEAVVE